MAVFRFFGPVRVCQERSSQSDKILIAILELLLRLLRSPGHGHADNRDVYGVLYLMGQVIAPSRGVAEGLRHKEGGILSCNTYIESVCTIGFQGFGNPDAFFKMEASLRVADFLIKFVDSQADSDRKITAAPRMDAFNDFF